MELHAGEAGGVGVTFLVTISRLIAILFIAGRFVKLCLNSPGGMLVDSRFIRAIAGRAPGIICVPGRWSITIERTRRSLVGSPSLDCARFGPVERR